MFRPGSWEHYGSAGWTAHAVRHGSAECSHKSLTRSQYNGACLCRVTCESMLCAASNPVNRALDRYGRIARTAADVGGRFAHDALPARA